jgi:hypothetical protein
LRSTISDGDGRFVLRNLVPGRYQLSVGVASVRGWRLASITVPQATEDRAIEARDVTWTPLVVEPGRDMFNAKVELTFQPAIAGVVRDETGRPIASRVVVLPLHAQKNAIADLQSRPDGTFSLLEDVPPGDYLAVAVRGAPLAFVRSREVLAALRQFAIRVTVGRAPDTAQITLTQVSWPFRGATPGPLLWSKH